MIQKSIRRSNYNNLKDLFGLNSKYLKTLMETRDIVWPHARRASNVKVGLEPMNIATHTMT